MRLRNNLARAVGTQSALGFAQLIRERVYWIAQTLRGTYAQHGEDILLEALFQGIVGTYVDIGANHPYILNNTYKLYRRGWRGVNVEPHRRLYGRLCRVRPEDVNLRAGAGPADGHLTFYCLWPASRSTFSQCQADSLISAGTAKLLAVEKVPVMTLASIAERLGPSGLAPHTLSIDTEGFELEVLAGADWATFRPRLVIIEADGHDSPKGLHISEFLTDRGYVFLRSLGCNDVYLRQEGLDL